MDTILIATHQKGFEADPVIDELRRRGLPIFRFNFEDGKNVSFSAFHQRKGEVSIGMCCDGIDVLGSDIGVGWCQQLPAYLGYPSDESQFLQRENLWLAQLAGLEALEIPWLNNPRAILRASNKVIQLCFAHKVGMSTPETLVSNDPEKIRSFVGSKDSVIAKNLATPWVIREGDTYSAHTKIVENEWLADDRALSFCPVIYQRFYPRRTDYRVVVVGGNFSPYLVRLPKSRRRMFGREGLRVKDLGLVGLIQSYSRN